MTLPANRFLALCTPEPNSGCWLWEGGVTPRKRDGLLYGRFCLKGRNWRAHRASFHLFCSPLPPGAFVCHRCDNTLCVNPDHLFLGNAQVNYDDMAAKGRSRRAVGQDNGFSKLTSAQVVEIRRRYAPRRVTYADLAAAFDVAPCTIARIIRRELWANV